MAQPTTSDYWNQTTPAAPSGDQNVGIQTDGATPEQSLTAYPKRATGSLFGTVKPDGTTISISGGVISAVPPTLFGYVGITIPAASLATTGFQGTQSVPYNGTITEWILLADGAACTAQITVSRASLSAFPTFASIVASAPPVITSAQKATSTTLTGWTTAVNIDDVFSFNLDSYSGTATELTLILKIQRS